MNTHAPSSCNSGRAGVGKRLASLCPSGQLRAQPEGLPHTLRALTAAQRAWLGMWVPRGAGQHLQYSYGFRCGMEPEEGIKLFDVGRGVSAEKVMGMRWEVWDSCSGIAAEMIIECSTTDKVSSTEVEWLAEQIDALEEGSAQESEARLPTLRPSQQQLLCHWG